MQALAAARPGWRQFYARYVVALYFQEDQDAEHHSTFRNLQFPRMQRITAGSAVTGETFPFTQYIQSNLQNFKWFGQAPAENILDLLETACRHKLRELDLCFEIDGLTSERLERFLDKCKFLKKLTIRGNNEHLINSRILERLVHYRGLEKLLVDAPIRIETVLQMAGPIRLPLKDIRLLGLRMQSVCVPLLVDGLKGAKNLTSLGLIIQDNAIDPFKHVCQLVGLKDLRIFYEQGQTWNVFDDVLELWRLANLRTLVLIPLNGIITCPLLLDDIFRHIFSQKARLQYLIFQVHCESLTTDSILALGHYSRQIKLLQFPGTYNLHRWSGVRGCRFPQVRWIEFGGVEYDDNINHYHNGEEEPIP